MEQKYIGGRELYATRRRAAARVSATAVRDDAPVIRTWWRILPRLAKNPEFLGYFVDEVALASRLQHPNIVRTIAAGRDDDGWFIAMEHLVGATAIELLRSACQQQLALPIGACVRIVVDAGLQRFDVGAVGTGRGAEDASECSLGA